MTNDGSPYGRAIALAVKSGGGVARRSPLSPRQPEPTRCSTARISAAPRRARSRALRKPDPAARSCSALRHLAARVCRRSSGRSSNVYVSAPGFLPQGPAARWSDVRRCSSRRPTSTCQRRRRSSATRRWPRCSMCCRRPAPRRQPLHGRARLLRDPEPHLGARDLLDQRVRRHLASRRSCSAASATERLCRSSPSKSRGERARRRRAAAGRAPAALAALRGCGCGSDAGRRPDPRHDADDLRERAASTVPRGVRCRGGAERRAARARARRMARIGQVPHRARGSSTTRPAARRNGTRARPRATPGRAVQDRTTVGYIGELNSGASAISIPLLNRAGIAQISPPSTAVGLTSDGRRVRPPGEPQKYYPTGDPHVRSGRPERRRAGGGAGASSSASLGCQQDLRARRRRGRRRGHRRRASPWPRTARGCDVVGVAGVRPARHRLHARSRAASRSSGADCVLISAITENHAALGDRARSPRRCRTRRSSPSAGVAESTFTDPAQGGIPLALDPRVLITVATLAASAYPPAGEGVLRRVRSGVTGRPSHTRSSATRR